MDAQPGSGSGIRDQLANFLSLVTTQVDSLEAQNRALLAERDRLGRELAKTQEEANEAQKQANAAQAILQAATAEAEKRREQGVRYAELIRMQAAQAATSLRELAERIEADGQKQAHDLEDAMRGALGATTTATAGAAAVLAPDVPQMMPVLADLSPEDALDQEAEPVIDEPVASIDEPSLETLSEAGVVADEEEPEVAAESALVAPVSEIAPEALVELVSEDKQSDAFVPTLEKVVAVAEIEAQDVPNSAVDADEAIAEATAVTVAEVEETTADDVDADVSDDIEIVPDVIMDERSTSEIDAIEDDFRPQLEATPEAIDDNTVVDEQPVIPPVSPTLPVFGTPAPPVPPQRRVIFPAIASSSDTRSSIPVPPIVPPVNTWKPEVVSSESASVEEVVEAPEETSSDEQRSGWDGPVIGTPRAVTGEQEAVAELEAAPDVAEVEDAGVVEAATYDVVAHPFTNFSSLVTFQKAIREIPGISDVRVRVFQNNALSMTLTYGGPADVASALQLVGGFDVSDIIIEGSKVEMTVVSSSSKASA